MMNVGEAKELIKKYLSQKMVLSDIVLQVQKESGLNYDEILDILCELVDLSYLDYAKIIMRLYPTYKANDLAHKLYEKFSNIKALELCTVLLDQEIFPNTKIEEMRNILFSCGYTRDEIDLALRYSYAIYITVKATEKWHDTGILLGKNELVKIRYLSGEWLSNPLNGLCDANGTDGHKGLPYYTMEGANDGALIGKLVDEVFLVGKEKDVDFDIDYKKHLYLCINDDIDKKYGCGLDDNKGELNLELKISLKCN